MNKDQLAGTWHQIRGKVKEQWGKLTDDDLKQLEGHAERLVGKLQQLYGLGREQAEHQVKEFRKRINWN
jgi:uncharacterized protein YjbJ (UPF0337 family)